MLKRVPVVMDTERDADLLRWLDQQENRSAAVREALRQALRPTPRLDAATIRRIVREELAGIQISGAAETPKDVSPTDADPEAGALLDAMF
jgi:heterodisulfide reductase subunit A-like polyferredoxin